MKPRMSFALRAATTFGLGFMRPASGTWGSLPTVLIAGGLIASGAGPVEMPILYHAVLAAVFLFFCWASLAGGGEAEYVFGKKDPGKVVADETAGQVLPLIALPAASLATGPTTLFTLAFAFVAFRVADIVKPWPARSLQKLPGGLGILVDDLFAGLYALAAVQIAAQLALG